MKCRAIGAVVALSVMSAATGALALELSEKFALSGFTMAHYSASDLPEDDGTFELHPIYVNMWARPQKNIHMLVELEYEHLPKVEDDETKGEIKTSQAHLKYVLSDALSIKLGQFYTEAGIWMPIHWRMLQPTYERPIFYENAQQMLPSRQVGVTALGERALDGMPVSLTYSAWLTLGPEDYGVNQAATELDNVGGNLGVTLWDNVTLGGAVNQVNATDEFTHDQDAFLVYGKVAMMDGRISVAAEYLSAEWTPQYDNTNTYSDIDALYLAVTYEFVPGWEAYYRYDIGDDLKRSGHSEPLSGVDAGTTINTAALTWYAGATTEVSFEYATYRFDAAEDYDRYRLTVGQMF